MMVRILLVGLVNLIFSSQGWADTNQDLIDVSTDVEEISMDSEAAVALAKAAGIRAAKEKEENARALKEAIKAREVAEAKRIEARSVQKRNDAQIEILLTEQAKIRGEINKLDKDNKINEKLIQESQAKVEKMKRDIQAAQELRTEKLAKSEALNKQKHEIIETVKAVEKQHAQATAEFKTAAEQEKIAIANLEKTTTEETQKKNRLQTEIARLKEQSKQARASASAMEKEGEKLKRANVKLEEELKVGQEEVKKAETPVATIELEPARDVAAISELTLKKDCNVREEPSREAKFLGVKRSGTNITKSEELDGWVGVTLSAGQKGFLLKNCF